MADATLAIEVSCPMVEREGEVNARDRSARRRTVRAADVAKLAGVSQTTVSYVLNGVTNQVIRPETRKRVMEAASDLGYAPSGAARTLRMGHSNIVLLAISSLRIGHSLGYLIEHLTSELTQLGLNLVVRRQEAGASLTPIWRELMPLAVVSSSPLDRADAQALVDAGVMLVGADREGALEQSFHFGVDQHRIGCLQAEYLIGKGHRHFGYAAPNNPRLQKLFDLRLGGVVAELARHRLGPPAVRIVPADAAEAAKVVAEWQSQIPSVTAVCAYNDESAFAVLAAMDSMGLKAPDDLAVIGVDNVNFAPFAHPPLTSIDNRMDIVAKIIALHCSRAAGASNELFALPRHEIALVVRQSA